MVNYSGSFVSILKIYKKANIAILYQHTLLLKSELHYLDCNPIRCFIHIENLELDMSDVLHVQFILIATTSVQVLTTIYMYVIYVNLLISKKLLILYFLHFIVLFVT